MAWKAKISSVALPPKFNSFTPIKLQASIPSNRSFLRKNHFNFLNIPHDFPEEINWNFAQHGKLWTYNLNYFEFLSQADLDKESGLSLIKEYIAAGDTLKDGLEPFPISLRTIFWIKFLVKHNVQDAQIDAFLFRQVKLLEQQLEYHLLGNHLLENGFALLFSAYYFSDNQMFSKSKKLLQEQLNEQILDDGSHFELSPMYHQLMLYRLLDCINLLKNNSNIFSEDFLAFLIQKADKMLQWLDYMTFENGSIPHFNDSTDGIAPSTYSLKKYAADLDISVSYKLDKFASLNYQKYKSEHYEIFMDVGDIGASYIPGHAHSDNLHFVLNSHGNPLIVDTGISSYEKNQLRHNERSTAAHNTVQIGNEEQSDVWGGFRVGRRAKSIKNILSQTKIKASHDGYKSMGTRHERTFDLKNNTITITDKLSTPSPLKARIHFHPSIKLNKKGNIIFGDFGTISFNNSTKIEIQDYQFAVGYNQLQLSKALIIHFKEHLQTVINFE